MSSEVAGISLRRFEDPIADALHAYSLLADHSVVFDTSRAMRLDPTPDKPNSARSSTPVRYKDEADIATLHVIAFAPLEGTGNPSTEPISGSTLGERPPGSPIMPRDKTGIKAEAHLTIASQSLEETRSSPVLFAGNLTLLGLIDGKVAPVGTLGQQSHYFVGVIHRTRRNDPTVTLTTGQGLSGERFGDPHAVVNTWNKIVQVAAFLAIHEDSDPKHLEALRLLHAAEPSQTI